MGLGIGIEVKTPQPERGTEISLVKVSRVIHTAGKALEEAAEKFGRNLSPLPNHPQKGEFGECLFRHTNLGLSVQLRRIPPSEISRSLDDMAKRMKAVDVPGGEVAGSASRFNFGDIHICALEHGEAGLNVHFARFKNDTAFFKQLVTDRKNGNPVIDSIIISPTMAAADIRLVEGRGASTILPSLDEEVSAKLEIDNSGMATVSFKGHPDAKLGGRTVFFAFVDADDKVIEASREDGYRAQGSVELSADTQEGTYEKKFRLPRDARFVFILGHEE